MILLDTHTWIWHLADRSSLSAAAREAIDAQTASGSILVSSISVWELHTLVKRGRLSLTVPPAAFMTASYRDPRFAFVAVDERIARTSVELPDVHRDPADRFIVASAIERGATLVSKDRRLTAYNECEVVW